MRTTDHFIVDVKRLANSIDEAHERHTLSAPVEGLVDLTLKSPFSGTFDLTKREGTIVAVLTDGSAMISQQCVRCLTTFERPITIAHAEKEYAVGFSADSAEVLEFDRKKFQLHLDPFIREELYLVLDAFPKCRQDCKGLCPICGANLNQKPCTHSQVIPPEENKPLKGLQDLYDDYQKQ